MNTGFVSDDPDILVPISVARALGLWPQPDGSLSVILGTAGGEIEGYVVPRSVLARVLAGDRASREILASVVVSALAEEVLISDALAEELGVQILYRRRGIWESVDEDKVRESERDSESSCA